MVMATATNAPLSAEEPSLPDTRKQHLRPKSYADAIQEPPTNGTNTNTTNGTHAITSNAENDSADSTAPQSKHTILRIVDTGAGMRKEELVEQEGKRPQLEREESNHEYTAAGLDDSPRTPPNRKHRRAGSQKIDRSQEESHASTMKGTKKSKAKDVTDIFEKVESAQNGSRLISVKPPPELEKQHRTDTKQTSKPSKEEKLASGKIAGQRWHNSGIRFAPMNVPLQRRLQTLMVLWHTLCIPLFISTFFFFCAIPLFWPLVIPYMIYCMTSTASTSGTLSHRWEFLRKSPIWSLFASYFPARLHRTQELPPTRKYIFGYHPHGIISLGAFGAFATDALGFSQLFPGIRNTLLTLDSNFRVPIYRDYVLAMGLASVSKESCENLLSKGGLNKEGMGRAITIVIGGARESLDANPYSLRLVLKRRKGFVKLAIRTGADLVPVLSFGENDLFDQFDPESHPTIHKFQLLIKKLLGFTVPLFHARGIFNYDVGLMPYRRPLNIVVGRPIKVAQSSKPEQEEIDRVHEQYVQELERLWELWKDDFAPQRKEEMQLIE